MPIQVWLARMERSLTEQEYGDMMALLPDARRERLEKLPKEKHQEVLCAYLLLRMALWEQRGWRDLPRIEVDELGKPFSRTIRISISASATRLGPQPPL